MIREAIGTGKTTDEAIEAACKELGVSRDDVNVSSEILELPVRKFFKTLPAKVKVSVEEEDKTPVSAPATSAPAPAKAEVPAAEKTAVPAAPAAKAVAEEETEVAIDPEENEKVKASIEYLTTVFAAMGVADVTFTPVQKGEATILKVEGKNVGALIGRRGETMEALSYLASLVANRMGGDYMKLGLDVAGYRNKRESDLEVLTRRICEKVIKSGHCYAVEPMNPYERRIIHSAVGNIEGVRSESAGEGSQRHVVIYSTDPNASNTPERSNDRRGPRRDSRGPRSGGPRGPRSGGDRGPRSGGSRGPRREGGFRQGGRDGERRGPRPSSVPERNFSEVAPSQAAPTAPSRENRINDGDGLALYGKIEL